MGGGCRAGILLFQRQPLLSTYHIYARQVNPESIRPIGPIGYRTNGLSALHGFWIRYIK